MAIIHHQALKKHANMLSPAPLHTNVGTPLLHD